MRILIDQRTARATTNRFDQDSIRSTIEQAMVLTKAAVNDPEVLPLAPAQPVLEAPRFDAPTAHATPEERANAVTEAIRLVEGGAQTAAGIYSTEESVEAIFNSAGAAAWHSETMARFSITTMADDSSGWAKASATAKSDIHPVELTRRALEKAKLSQHPREVAAGRYMVILEPAATLDLVGQMFGDFSATAIRDGRSFLNDRMGRKLFGENITIHDDVWHPGQSGTPFDGEGVPRKRLTLVESGVVRDIAYSRHAAALAGVEPTGHGFPLPNEFGEAPANIVIAGGESTVDQMVASTDRGILVTRLWYIREVDPYEKIFTGMTRDGTFLVEGGQIVAGVRNFRFNESLIEMLSNVEALGPAVRSSGEETFDMVAPPMKVGSFHFTEVTKF